MAEAWVSTVSANGIPVSDGSGTVGNDQDPYNTIESAIAATSSGDTIWINGVSAASPTTYTEDANGTYLTVGEDRTFKAVVSKSVIVESTRSAASVELDGVAACYFDGIIFQTNGFANSSAMRIEVGTTPPVFKDCEFYQGSSNTITTDEHFVCVGDTKFHQRTDSGYSNDLIHWAPETAGVTMIDGATVTGRISGDQFLQGAPALDGCSLVVQNITGTLTHNGSASNQIFNITGAEEIYLRNITMNIASGNGTDDTSPAAVLITEHATIACDKIRIINVKSTNSYTSFPTGGYGVRIGQEAAGSGAGIDDVKVVGCSFTGFNHGLMCGGGVTNFHGFGNRADDVKIGILTNVADATCKWTGNKVTGVRDGSIGLYHKGSTGAIIANNEIVTDGQSRTVAIMGCAAEGATNCNDPKFYNNVIRHSGGYEEIVDVQSSQTATLRSNAFFVDLPAVDSVAAFIYGGTGENIGDYSIRDIGCAFHPTNLAGLGFAYTGGIDIQGHEFLDPPSVGTTELNTVIDEDADSYEPANTGIRASRRISDDLIFTRDISSP